MPNTMIIRLYGKAAIKPEQLKKILHQVAPETVDSRLTFIDTNQQEGLRISYQRSIDNAANACHLLCDAILYAHPNFNKKKFSQLKSYVEHLRDEAVANLQNRDNFSGYQAVLNDYIQKVHLVMQEQFSQYSELDKIVSGLASAFAKADEYGVLSTQRPALTTITACDYHDPETGYLKSGYMIQLETPQVPLDDDKMAEILSAKPDNKINPPEWYTMMPAHERYLFDYHMRDADKNNIHEKFQAISSRHRTIPGVANFSLHKMVITDEAGLPVYIAPARLRSSMISSRDMIKKNQTLRDEITTSNLSHIIRQDIERSLNDPVFLKRFKKLDGSIDKDKLKEYVENTLSNKPILIQTLISPLAPLKMFIPDPDLYHDKQRAIQFIRKNGIDLHVADMKIKMLPKYLFDTNHPMNKVRDIAGTGSFLQSGDTQKEGERIVELARNAANKIHKSLASVKSQSASLHDDAKFSQAAHDAKALRYAADELDKLLHPSKELNEIDNQRELHLAGLEEFIITRIGGVSYGSCVSGKDRKALETMYVDAMEYYYYLHGELPKYDDTPANRNKFIDIYARIFLTNHHQMNAGQNAPGADGIKTPAKYLPADIQQRIIELSGNKDILIISDRLASNNEIDHLIKKLPSLSEIKRQDITRRRYSSSSYSASSSAVQKAESLDSIMYKLISIIQSEPFWGAEGEGVSMPAGVKRLTAALSDPLFVSLDADGKIETLAKICKEHVDKGVSSRRSEVTNEFYNLIMGIYNNIDQPSNYYQYKLLDEFYSRALSFVERYSDPVLSQSNSNSLLIKRNELHVSDSNPLSYSDDEIKRFNEHSAVAPMSDVYQSLDDIKDAIIRIIKSDYWNDKGSIIGMKTVPSGIAKMREFIKSDENAAMSPDKLIPALTAFIGKSSDKRAPSTAGFYALLIGVSENMDDPNKFPGINKLTVFDQLTSVKSSDSKPRQTL